ncbi:MAG: hypothetical protein ACRDBG_19485, partial [Waterburya sp.]
PFENPFPFISSFLSDHPLPFPFLFVWLVWLSGFLINSLYLNPKRRIFVEPDEVRKRIKQGSTYKRHVFCAKCKQKMQKVEDTEIQNQLSKPEKIAHEIGSIKVESWQCSRCSQHPVALVYTSDLSISIKKCYGCDELTLTHSEMTLEYSTTSKTGKRLIKDQCHCCDYYEEKVESIPRLSSSSGSSSSSSSSDFGGGSSGGGGAGGSY